MAVDRGGASVASTRLSALCATFGRSGLDGVVFDDVVIQKTGAKVKKSQGMGCSGHHLRQ